jgi:hypothetical protein
MMMASYLVASTTAPPMIIKKMPATRVTSDAITRSKVVICRLLGYLWIAQVKIARVVFSLRGIWIAIPHYA